MDNIQKSELGTMLSTCVMGLIIMALLTASLFSKEVFSAFLNVGTGWLIGIFIGLFFSFCNHKTTNQEGGDENANN
jgi:preprotein translocase subunit SecG